MVEIGCQSLEGEIRIPGCKILLVGKVVVQAEKIIEVDRPNSNSLAKLEGSGLPDEAWSGCFRIDGSDRGTCLAGAGTNVYKSTIDLAVHAGVQPFIERLHGAAAHDRLRHAIEGAAGGDGGRP